MLLFHCKNMDILELEGDNMKKMLFGLGLLLSGVVGFTGWCIAATGMVEPGARSNIWGCLDGSEWIVLFVFVVIAVAGLIISAVEFKKN